MYSVLSNVIANMESTEENVESGSKETGIINRVAITYREAPSRIADGTPGDGSRVATWDQNDPIVDVHVCEEALVSERKSSFLSFFAQESYPIIREGLSSLGNSPDSAYAPGTSPRKASSDCRIDVRLVFETFLDFTGRSTLVSGVNV